MTKGDLNHTTKTPLYMALKPGTFGCGWWYDRVIVLLPPLCEYRERLFKRRRDYERDYQASLPQGRTAADGSKPRHGRDDRKQERSFSGLSGHAQQAAGLVLLRVLCCCCCYSRFPGLRPRETKNFLGRPKSRYTRQVGRRSSHISVL